jgi:RNA polymerase sigma-70 factor, ECF subfamily
MTSGTQTEAQAIEAFKNGNTACFEILYTLHKRRVYSLCLRMAGDRTLAEDLTQEVFLLLFRKLKSFRGESAFTTWLHRISVNVVLMHMRQSRSRGPTVSLDELDGFEDGSHEEAIGLPDPVLAQSIDRVALQRAIGELPPGYRLILVLHDIEGYEHQEIAELLGCSMGNTKSQLHKARLKLRKLLLQGAATQPTPAAVRSLQFRLLLEPSRRAA